MRQQRAGIIGLVVLVMLAAGTALAAGRDHMQFRTGQPSPGGSTAHPGVPIADDLIAPVAAPSPSDPVSPSPGLSVRPVAVAASDADGATTVTVVSQGYLDLRLDRIHDGVRGRWNQPASSDESVIGAAGACPALSGSRCAIFLAATEGETDITALFTPDCVNSGACPEPRIWVLHVSVTTAPQ